MADDPGGRGSPGGTSRIRSRLPFQACSIAADWMVSHGAIQLTELRAGVEAVAVQPERVGDLAHPGPGEDVQPGVEQPEQHQHDEYDEQCDAVEEAERRRDNPVRMAA